MVNIQRVRNVLVICILNAVLSSLQTGSRDSLVGTATCYWLEGLGSNPGGDEIFRIHSDRSRDSGLFAGGNAARGVALTTSSAF
jgi:hypothetical protein